MELDISKKRIYSSVLDSTCILELCFQYFTSKEKLKILCLCCKRWKQIITTSIPCWKYEQIKIIVGPNPLNSFLLKSCSLLQYLELNEVRDRHYVTPLDKLNQLKEIKSLKLNEFKEHFQQLSTIYFPKLTTLKLLDNYSSDLSNENGICIQEFVSRHSTIHSLFIILGSFDRFNYFAPLYISLKKLVLTIRGISNKKIELLSKFIHLEYLTITTYDLTEEQTEEEEEKKYMFPSLTYLCLDNYFHLFSSFDSLSKLEHLTINSYGRSTNPLLDAKTTEYLNQQKFPCLQTLSLYGLKGCSSFDFSFLTTSTCLKEISLSSLEEKNYENLFTTIKTHPESFFRLKTFIIKLHEKKKEGKKQKKRNLSFDFLIHLPQLNQLYIRYNLFSKWDLYYISDLSCLQDLVLTYNIPSQYNSSFEIEANPTCSSLAGHFKKLLPLKSTLKSCKLYNIYVNEKDKEIWKEFTYGKYFEVHLR